MRNNSAKKINKINIVVMGCDGESWSDITGTEVFCIKYDENNDYNPIENTQDFDAEYWSGPDSIEDGVQSVRKLSPMEAWIKDFDGYDELDENELEEARIILEDALEKVTAKQGA